MSKRNKRRSNKKVIAATKAPVNPIVYTATVPYTPKPDKFANMINFLAGYIDAVTDFVGKKFA